MVILPWVVCLLHFLALCLWGMEGRAKLSDCSQQLQCAFCNSGFFWNLVGQGDTFSSGGEQEGVQGIVGFQCLPGLYPFFLYTGDGDIRGGFQV